jgi:hypothetical protein
VNDDVPADGPDFPDPSTDAGRLLATLIAANVPGTVATWSADDLATAAGLAPLDADAALTALVSDGIVGGAREGQSVRLTVLLAPPLDAYGVVPKWGDDDTNVEPTPSVAEALAEAGLPDVPRGRVRAVGGLDRHPFEEGEVTQLFMERFERLLVECDEWRRRALGAEDRLTGVERQLRSVERRAEASQARLDAATEKIRAWSELTRRMNQLVKQADALARSRPSRRVPPTASDTAAACDVPVGQEVATASCALRTDAIGRYASA